MSTKKKEEKKRLYQCFEIMACKNTEVQKMAKLRSCLLRKQHCSTLIIKKVQKIQMPQLKAVCQIF